MIKNLPAVQETWVRSLGLEDPLSLGKGNGYPFPVFLPGKIQWTEEPGGLPSMGSQESDTT